LATCFPTGYRYLRNLSIYIPDPVKCQIGASSVAATIVYRAGFIGVMWVAGKPLYNLNEVVPP
ncbi:MAG: hypothetical protein ACYSWQ_10135, partial [Planctomycetota bacterium]